MEIRHEMDAPFYYGVLTTQPTAADEGIMIGDVLVRNMNSNDADFAGPLLVEGFRRKFTHVAGENNLPIMVSAMREDYEHQTEKHRRCFVAEYNGQKAGLMELKFHKDRSRMAPEGERHLRRLPCCCVSIRLLFSWCATDMKVARDRCLVDAICVESRFRGKGVGNALMTFADMEARKRSCQHIYLYVADDNRAKNLYARCGYREVDRWSGCCPKCATGVQTFVKMEKAL